MLQNARSTRQNIPLACQSVNPAKVVHFCFRFASFGKVYIEMPGVLQWFLQLTLFGCLQHSTLSQLSSSVFRFSFPFHFTCLAVRSKEQNGAFVMCTPVVTSLNSLTAQAEFVAIRLKYVSIFTLTVGLSNF